MILIEKEFLSFGHQFALRIGISQKDSHNEDQRSPIFLQWLDTIHQLLHQFPDAFEFNMEFLLYLAFHYNSCLYGTFMYNCESERFEKKAKQKTTSIWTDMLKNLNRYINNRYNPVEIIFPNSSPYKMRFWEEFFFRYNTSVEKNYNLYGNNANSSIFAINSFKIGGDNVNGDYNNISTKSNFKRDIGNIKIDEEKNLKNNQENNNNVNLNENGNVDSENIIQKVSANNSWKEIKDDDFEEKNRTYENKK